MLRLHAKGCAATRGHACNCGSADRTERTWIPWAEYDDALACNDPPAPDPVNHPPHYTAHPSGVECIQITEHLNFCLGNAVKYLWRAGLKADAIEDLKKARFYVDREIARLEQAAHDAKFGEGRD